MVDYRGKDKRLVFAVYEAYCRDNFQPTKWSDKDFYCHMKPFAANLEYRSRNGGNERKVLWLRMPELKAAWEKNFGYKLEDIAGLKLDDNVFVLN
jgi:hypothetical protein